MGTWNPYTVPLSQKVVVVSRPATTSRSCQGGYREGRDSSFVARWGSLVVTLLGKVYELKILDKDVMLSRFLFGGAWST